MSKKTKNGESKNIYKGKHFHISHKNKDLNKLFYHKKFIKVKQIVFFK
jgi:hypothetical protein